MGDSCHAWTDEGTSAAEQTSPRPCFYLKTYIKSARQMKTMYNISRVAVATDSDSIIEELKEYADEFEFVYLPFNRTLVSGPDRTINEATDKSQDMEYRNDLHEDENLKSLVFASAAAEMK